jgi:hypothetical protein
VDGVPGESPGSAKLRREHTSDKAEEGVIHRFGWGRARATI